VESTSYTPPAEGFSIERASLDLMHDILEGVTHIYLRCEKCGNVKEKRVRGKYKHPILS
jgi:hypothetical protein